MASPAVTSMDAMRDPHFNPPWSTRSRMDLLLTGSVGRSTAAEISLMYVRLNVQYRCPASSRACDGRAACPLNTYGITRMSQQLSACGDYVCAQRFHRQLAR